MSWRIDNHPDGGMMIEHLDAPRFTARWTTGDFPIEDVRDGGFFWTDEGGSPEDAIHLYGFEWRDAVPQNNHMKELMGLAVLVIEGFVMGKGQR